MLVALIILLVFYSGVVAPAIADYLTLSSVSPDVDDTMLVYSVSSDGQSYYLCFDESGNPLLENDALASEKLFSFFSPEDNVYSISPVLDTKRVLTSNTKALDVDEDDAKANDADNTTDSTTASVVFAANDETSQKYWRFISAGDSYPDAFYLQNTVSKKYLSARSVEVSESDSPADEPAEDQTEAFVENGENETAITDGEAVLDDADVPEEDVFASAGAELVLVDTMSEAVAWKLQHVELVDISSWDFPVLTYNAQITTGALDAPTMLTYRDNTLELGKDYRVVVSYDEITTNTGAFVIEGIGLYTGTVTIYAEPVYFDDNTVVNLREVDSGKLLALDKKSVSQGAHVVLEVSCDKPRQAFRLQSAGDGTYYLVNYLTEKVLDVSGSSLEEGVEIVQWGLTGGDNQKWRLVRSGNGFKLQSVLSGYYLGIDSDSGIAITVRSSSKCAQVFELEIVDADKLKVYSATPNVLSVVEKCNQVGWPGPNWCAYWVEEVFYAAGWGYHYGNANTLYYRCCYSESLSELEVGMIVATATCVGGTEANAYGHVGIYIGDGWVMDSSSTGVRTVSFDYWYSHYGQLCPVRWGWISG